MAQGIPRTINVLEINANLEYAGGQRNMVTFAKYLRKDIFSVTVCAYRDGGPLENVIKSLGITCVVAHGDVEKIATVIKEKNIDIIHIHRSGGYVAIEKKILSRAKEINPNIVIIEKNVFGKYDPSVDALLDCSLFQSMMHIHERYIPKSHKAFNFKNQKVFYNLVDREEFESYRASKENIEKFREKIGAKSGDYLIGKIARPALEKWSDLLIDMVPYLVRKIQDFKIVIIGCPESRIRRINKSKYKNFFIILPETSEQRDIHLFYQSIDVLAHSSKIGECNGNTINEAMFWKKPVLVNSTPRKDNGQLEQVIHMQNGIVANTPMTFARALEYLRKNENEAKKMGEAGYLQICSEYDPIQVTKRLEKVFFEKINIKDFLVPEEYASIAYHPTEQEVREYKQEYRVRLKWEFGTLSVMDRLCLIVLFPRKFYFKLRDFVEHKWKSYVR